MTETNRSAILVAAADHIRDLAAPTTPPPWVAYYDNGLYSVAGPGGEPICTDAENNGEWIAALSPAVAPTLETLLRVAAVEEASPSPLGYGSASLSAFMTVARALARDLVGEDKSSGSRPGEQP